MKALATVGLKEVGTGDDDVLKAVEN